MHKNWTRRLLLVPVLAVAWMTHGCAQIGAIGGVIAQAIPKHVDAAYKGMAHQNVIIMVWVDRSVRMDYPDLQVDLASGLQNKLIETQFKDHPDDLDKTVFPVTATMVIADQDKHPELEQEPITEVAKRYECTRLIVVSVSEFTVHSTMSQELFRGKMTCDIKVVEVTPDKSDPENPRLATAKQAYTESDISSLYPKDSPTDGLPIGTESTITAGTMNDMIDKLAKKFYGHLEDQD